MKICFFTMEYPPETGWGGLGTYIYNLAHELARLGNEVHVISKAYPDVRDYNDGLVYVHRVKQHRDGENRHIKTPLISTLDGFWEWFSISYSNLKEFQKLSKSIKFDIVQAPEHYAEGFFYSLNKKTPLVVRLHTPQFLLARLNQTHLLAGSVLDKLEIFTAKRADKLTSVSASLALEVSRKWKLDPDEVTVIHNGIDLCFIDSSKSAKVDYVHRDRPTVIYIGRLELRKGVCVLAKAIPKVVKEVDKVDFHFIGKDTNFSPTGGSMKEYLIGMLAKADVLENVKFLGHISDQAKKFAKLFLGDVEVIPSLYEAFGNTVIEGMACKKTVVASRCGGIPEIIKDGTDGVLVEPNNPNELANALIHLLQDRKTRERIGKRARKTVEERFTLEIMARKTLEAYYNTIEMVEKKANC